MASPKMTVAKSSQGQTADIDKVPFGEDIYCYNSLCGWYVTRRTKQLGGELPGYNLHNPGVWYPGVELWATRGEFGQAQRETSCPSYKEARKKPFLDAIRRIRTSA